MQTLCAYEGNHLLIGSEVKIRTLREEDLKKFYLLSTDYTDAGEYMPVSLQSYSDYQQEFDRNGFWRDHAGRLAIENDTGDLVGEVGLFRTAHYMDGRELYYRVFQNFRRKGYAREALRLLVSFFFESSSCNRLQAVVIQGNTVSANMLSTMGFKQEGTMRSARWFKGRLVDLDVYSYLRSEWAHNK